MGKKWACSWDTISTQIRFIPLLREKYISFKKVQGKNGWLQQLEEMLLKILTEQWPNAADPQGQSDPVLKTEWINVFWPKISMATMSAMCRIQFWKFL